MRAVILAGLGNPGASYTGNRHNIGFMAVDQLAQDYGFRPWAAKFGGLLAEGKVDGHKVFAFKPMGYMNTSGDPLSRLATFYKIPPEDLYVIHDELDLLPAKLRVKKGGSNGGHNGLKSIDAHLGPE
ncbi:MAG: aminoacyl-tRNA hydrolase, partial [Proteobacteria bacterium]|nr:aminoacyl-tRNA hydrolase [Pseudomonadota bacterium]